MLQTKYGLSEKVATKVFGIPYIISACTSPFLGLLIDKVGKRVHLVILSSFLLLLAHVITMILPVCDGCYSEVGPLVLTGIGYSIYAAALWGSVPYVVEARTVGTAFGLCTAV